MNVKVHSDQFLLFLLLYLKDNLDEMEEIDHPIIKKIRNSNLKTILNQLNSSNVPADLRLSFSQIKHALKTKEYIRISS